jgi:hypothetical protein
MDERSLLRQSLAIRRNPRVIGRLFYEAGADWQRAQRSFRGPSGLAAVQPKRARTAFGRLSLQDWGLTHTSTPSSRAN